MEIANFQTCDILQVLKISVLLRRNKMNARAPAENYDFQPIQEEEHPHAGKNSE